MTTVHVVTPDGVDDPTRPSGGNTYDRRLCQELEVLGWSVRKIALPGFWSTPAPAAFAALDRALQRVPDDTLVLLDGLVASKGPGVLVPQAKRLRLVVLVHQPLGHLRADDETRRREGSVLAAATAVVTTSAWSRRRLIELYQLPSDQVHVAQPGADRAELAGGTATGGALLCVAAVTFDKGHDVLLDALASISDVPWRCMCVGSLDREPAFAGRLRSSALQRGLGDRISFPGPRTGADLDRCYDAADALVLASRGETYGMVITEALARGLPVIAAEVGGVSEAVGECPDGTRPGMLVPAEDPAALGAALRAWLDDSELRTRLRRAVRERRASLPAWVATASVVAEILTETPG